jgi:hypothetical protein
MKRILINIKFKKKSFIYFFYFLKYNIMSTLYFEDFDRSYDDLEKEGLNLDDLLVKSKFAFLNGKYTFSSKSKFAFGTKNSASHEYSLKQKLQNATINLKHKASGETTIDADAKCYTKDNLTLRTFSKFVLNQNEKSKNLDATVMLRFHHKENNLLSVGFENWSALNGSPENITAYTSYGHNKNDAKLVFNTYLNYNFVQKFLPKASFLLRAEQGDVHGYLQANVNRNRVETNETENPVHINQAIDLLAKVVKVVDSKQKVGATIGYNLESKKSDVAVYWSKVLDRVRLNARVTTDRALTVGVTSAFDDVTVNFAAGSVLNTKTETVGEVETKNHWADFNFGLTVEFNRV